MSGFESRWERGPAESLAAGLGGASGGGYVETGAQVGSPPRALRIGGERTFGIPMTGRGGGGGCIPMPGGGKAGGGGGGASFKSGAGGFVAIGNAGGSGVVIVRYSGTPVATGGTITQSGGYTYHTFTTSSNFIT